MKKFLIILCLLFFSNVCYSDTYTRIEHITEDGHYLATPEYFIEIWEYDTNKSSRWIPSHRLIVTERGYLINIDRNETVRMVDLEVH